MKTIAADRYPQAVRELLPSAGVVMPLDAGSPNESVRARLAKLEPADVVAGPIADRQMAEACLAGLWLLHNFLDESHRISQDLHTTTGSCWHGIMHRREGDYDNAKYWFRQAGAHAAFVPLRQAARNEYIRDPGRSDTTRAFAPLDILTLLDDERAWNPYSFVDLCKAACHGRADLEKSCRTIQMLEWRTLFDYCQDQATRAAS